MSNIWISITNRLPEQGQYIKGRNAKGKVWIEEWDSTEPLGAMVEWQPYESYVPTLLKE